jgi:hypothetical protein
MLGLLGVPPAWAADAVGPPEGPSPTVAGPLLATEAATATPPVLPQIAARRLVLNSLNIFRWNPIGLESQNRFGWQQKLYEGHSRATNDNFWFAGTYVRLNPASVRAAAMVEVQPVALFNLRLSAERLQYYGNFTFLQSRPSANDDLSDAEMKRNATGALGNYAGGGYHVSVEPTLQAQVGPIVVRNKAFFGYFDMDLRAGDRVWYEPTLDVPVPDRGWVFANDADVLYRRQVGEAMLSLGVRYSLVRPWYQSNHLLAGQDPAASLALNDHHRVGLLAAWTWYDRGGKHFDKPSVILIASRYLSHRSRAGEGPNAVAGGGNMPYVVLGFAFQTDLLGK